MPEPTQELTDMLEITAALGDEDDSTEEDLQEPADEEEGDEELAEDADEEDEGGEEEPPEGDEPQDEVAQLRSELAAMRQTMATMMSKQPQQQAPPAEEPEEVNFLDGIDMEDLQEDPKAFNAILNKVLQEGVRIGREGILRDLPNIVTHNVQQQTTLKRTIDSFYKDNKDLVPFKRVVGAVAEEILSAQPELSLEELFKKAATEARVRLALVKKAGATTADKKRKPALPGKQRGARMRTAQPELTQQEADVLDLIKGV